MSEVWEPDNILLSFPKGDPGPPGPRGPRGYPGATGTAGIGSQGPEGLQGPKGDRGDKGEKGDKGDPGPSGSQGSEGPSAFDIAKELDSTLIGPEDWLEKLKGPRGIDGINGINGVDGLPGPVGPMGLIGIPGLNGAPGSKWHSLLEVPDLSIGMLDDFAINKVTGDVYQKTLSGWAQQINLMGPIGPQGPAGSGSGSYPLNGSFETLDESNIPENWTFTHPNFWDKSFLVDTDAGHGGYSLHFQASDVYPGTSRAESALFPTPRNGEGDTHLTFRHKVSDPEAAGEFIVTVKWYGSDNVFISQEQTSIAYAGLLTTWGQTTLEFTPPAAAALMTVTFSDEAMEVPFWIDGVAVTPATAAATLPEAQSIEIIAYHSVEPLTAVAYNTWTTVPFKTEETNTLGGVTTGSEWKYVVPIGKAGPHFITATAALNNVPPGGFSGRILMAITKNGSELSRGTDLSSLSQNDHEHVVSAIANLIEGDEIKIRILNLATGATLYFGIAAQQCRVGIAKLSSGSGGPVAAADVSFDGSDTYNLTSNTNVQTSLVALDEFLQAHATNLYSPVSHPALAISYAPIPGGILGFTNIQESLEMADQEIHQLWDDAIAIEARVTALETTSGGSVTLAPSGSAWSVTILPAGSWSL